jgi:hypothetical protein
MLGVPLVVTDMVIEEATRNENLWWHAETKAWLARNHNRITRLETATGREYLQAMELWRAAGEPPHLQPQTANKGDRSIQDAVEAYEGKLDPDQTLIAVVDERKLRRRLTQAEINIELLSTRGLFSIIEKDLHQGDAQAMWRLVKREIPTMDPIDRTDVVRNVRHEDDGIAAPSAPPPWNEEQSMAEDED